MANLVLDFGNTRIKAGIFDGNTLQSISSYNSVSELSNDIPALIKNSNHIIISSVTQEHKGFIEQISSSIQPLIFDHSTSLPIQNNYLSPETLGSDRLACAVGSHTLYPNQNSLSIDCGTCIKYDLVLQGKGYMGGAIAPGLQMRLNAMHEQTAKLPLLSVSPAFDVQTGRNTHESMLSGALLGAVAEVDGVINTYRSIYPDIAILLTGGDADFFAKRLKNSIFAHPNLVLIGLNSILNHSLEKN